MYLQKRVFHLLLLYYRPLIPLDDDEASKQQKKQKLEEVKSFIDKIPTEKDELFKYPIDWNIIDKVNLALFYDLHFSVCW
jgi:hypothetical protein